jgi:uncharacterized protein involved in type VI secretion and phage assembly
MKAAPASHLLRGHPVVGLVSSLEDPDNLGRIQVTFPHLGGKTPSDWVRIVSPMAGKKMGFFTRPEVGDEVLIAFEHGDLRRPYMLGALWSSVDGPPVDDGNAKANNWRQFCSRGGHVLKFDDTKGAEKIEIIAKGKKHKILLDPVEGKIVVECSSGDVEVKASGGSVKVEAKTIELKASGSMKLEAGGEMTIKGATVNIN